jgi:hypothetical protein
MSYGYEDPEYANYGYHDDNNDRYDYELYSDRAEPVYSEPDHGYYEPDHHEPVGFAYEQEEHNTA